MACCPSCSAAGVRAPLPTRDVSPADLRRVFEAARWAASSNNEQPWRFLVGTRNSSTHQKIFSTLVGFNQSWAGAAPVLILGVDEQQIQPQRLPKRIRAL